MWSTRKYRRIRVRKILRMVIPVLVGVAYMTLAERKVRASIQRRRGPNVVGRYGVFTPLADGLKLVLKETIIPTSANPYLFVLAPVLTFMLALVGWAVIPVGYGMVLVDVDRGRRFLFAISSLAVYGIIRGGWSSNSKYAFLGGLRSAAQMVSYEVSIGLTRIAVLLCTGSMNLTKIVRAQTDLWYRVPRFPMFRMFCVSALAETNRHPFDLPEAEAELVSGYNVEYSAAGFVLFFLGEYTNMILMSGMISILFRGGWLAPRSIRAWIPESVWFGRKTTLMLRGFIWARAAYPRFRYDQLMRLGWKVFLPVSRGWVVFTSGVLIGFNGL